MSTPDTFTDKVRNLATLAEEAHEASTRLFEAADELEVHGLRGHAHAAVNAAAHARQSFTDLARAVAPASP